MAPKELTRQQISSRLAYSQHTPSFLLKLQNRMNGTVDEESDDEFEHDGSGRPPIPRRPAIPERPDDDPGSADEDGGDEKPQVVVLKEGKHLTEREAENIKRKERGLLPLPDPEESVTLPPAISSDKEPPPKAKIQGPTLSFSSSKAGYRASAGKRKAAGETDEKDNKHKGASGPTKKKAKKARRTLLSFDHDA